MLMIDAADRSAKAIGIRITDLARSRLSGAR